MKPIHYLFFICSFTIACKPPQSTSNTTVEKYKLDKPLSTNHSLLWQISGNGLQQPSYLFGTIHIIDQENYFLGKNTERKLINSSELVMEVDIDNIDILAVAQLSLLPDGKTVKQFMNDSDYVVLQKFMADSIGINKFSFENGYAKFKPFYLEQLLYVKHMGQRNESYEMNLKKIAAKKNIPISGLETYEEQLLLFEDIPIEEQLLDLVGLIKNYSQEIEKLQQLIQLYIKQDLPGLAKAFEEEEDQEMMDKLLKLRNNKWLPKIDTLIREKSVFIAVGAGHLGGEHGLIKLLQNQGYTVEPISTN